MGYIIHYTLLLLLLLLRLFLCVCLSLFFWFLFKETVLSLLYVYYIGDYVCSVLLDVICRCFCPLCDGYLTLSCVYPSQMRKENASILFGV